MKTVFTIVGLLFGWAGVAAGAVGLGNYPFYTVHGELLGLDGKPAPGLTVHLVGVDRFCLGRDTEEDGTPRPAGELAAWRFVTDEKGRFTVRLWNIPHDEWNKVTPGFPTPGLFFLVVSPGPDNAGAISPRLDTSHFWGPFTDGWPTLRIEHDIDLTLRLVHGVTVRGQILDIRNGAPLPGVTVLAYSDLHATTHTGWGGELADLNGVAGTTDSRGRFVLRNVYPNFTLGLRESSGLHVPPQISWLKTEREGRWIDDAVDAYVIDPRQRDFGIGILAATAPSFHYFGRVIDGEGKPVSGAKVTVAVSSHHFWETWGDQHFFPSATTDPDGRWSYLAATPWVRGLMVEKQGARVDRNWDPRDFYPPGRYDFVLPAPPIGTEKP